MEQMWKTLSLSQLTMKQAQRLHPLKTTKDGRILVRDRPHDLNFY